MQESNTETKREPSTDDLTEEEALDIARAIHEVDACEACHGERGGVLGNENVVTIGDVQKIVCDYCHAELMDSPNK